MGSTMTVRGASRSEDKKRFRICFAALLCFLSNLFSIFRTCPATRLHTPEIVVPRQYPPRERDREGLRR